MKRIAALGGALAILATACAGGGGPEQRTILVDFSHDQFASYFLRYYPALATVRQGDTLVFKQTWTGEPHTVTAGKLLGKLGKIFHPYLVKLSQGKPLPLQEPKELEEEGRKLPMAFGDQNAPNQVAAQPCYIRSGRPPAAKDKPCANRKQPATFDGTYDYYNSGVIPYQGTRGNTFRVKLSPNIKPGKYFFMCSVHGVIQSTEVTVKPKGASAPSQELISKQARAEINRDSKPLLEDFRDAQDGRLTLGSGDQKLNFSGNFAGLTDPRVFYGDVNEFIPRQLTVKAGEKITWNILGGHTISFNVPAYLPIIRVAKDGTVSLNPELYPPAGGAPKVTLPDHREGRFPVDAGAYDGTGFWSSGVIESYEPPFVEYTMSITKPGTYKYACLVHPPMVGMIVVT